MKIKKGDNVMVIAGKDKGKTGKIIRALPKLDKVIVEGVNVQKRHQRATKSNQKGQILDKTLPIHVSNVQILDPKDGKPTRIGYKIENDKNVRVAKRSNAVV